MPGEGWTQDAQTGPEIQLEYLYLVTAGGPAHRLPTLNAEVQPGALGMGGCNFYIIYVISKY